jgi:hypothetical protein
LFSFFVSFILIFPFFPVQLEHIFRILFFLSLYYYNLYFLPISSLFFLTKILKCSYNLVFISITP